MATLVRKMSNEDIVEFINKIQANAEKIFIRDKGKTVALIDLPTDLAIDTVCAMIKTRITSGKEVGRIIATPPHVI